MSDLITTDQHRAHEIASRIATLEAITPVISERVMIPQTDIVLNITRPADIDALLDDVLDDPEQNLPYWAEIWPSGIALSTEVLTHPGLLCNQPVIELGCGAGITAATALMVGANLTVTDYSAHSLLLTELTCLQAGVNLPPARQINWRESTAHLLQDSGEQWPRILAADVLYEERDIEPVLVALERMLAPGGIVLLAEPGRRPARTAMQRAKERGWQITTRNHTGPWPDPKDADVTVTVHIMKR